MPWFVVAAEGKRALSLGFGDVVLGSYGEDEAAARRAARKKTARSRREGHGSYEALFLTDESIQKLIAARKETRQTVTPSTAALFSLVSAVAPPLTAILTLSSVTAPP